ncbi:hypothetical protein GDO86_018489 [Hymenochirus boettgeri]|uniref:Uncharacterized protein n=1 Tax=Hymenochirus boettgeri TaxID=247094 RepID=A0A8T2IH71_9PIPI|nr:hypothetical protein GDO86_018489 [Hymenochirus boettgeri]
MTWSRGTSTLYRMICSDHMVPPPCIGQYVLITWYLHPVLDDMTWSHGTSTLYRMICSDHMVPPPCIGQYALVTLHLHPV